MANGKVGKESQTILVVDDEPEILDLFLHMFKNSGYAVSTARSGYEAILKGRKRLYPLAFIDIILPGINGLETFLELKKINPKIKVVMITGYALPEVIKEALAAGAYSCIKKPFQIKKILALTDEILNP